MHFDIILLSDVIWAFGPKVTRRDTYCKDKQIIGIMAINRHMHCYNFMMFILQKHVFNTNSKCKNNYATNFKSSKEDTSEYTKLPSMSMAAKEQENTTAWGIPCSAVRHMIVSDNRSVAVVVTESSWHL